MKKLKTIVILQRKIPARDWSKSKPNALHGGTIDNKALPEGTI